jgi:hypothetical protein
VDANGAATRVEAVAWNKERHLIFSVPTLAAGSYTLEVRAILNDNLRPGKLEAVRRFPPLAVCRREGLSLRREL